jgi:hypothetical protein
MDAAILEDTQPEPALSAAAETEGVALEAYKVANEKIASTVSQEVQKVEGPGRRSEPRSSSAPTRLQRSRPARLQRAVRAGAGRG